MNFISHYFSILTSAAVQSSDTLLNNRIGTVTSIMSATDNYIEYYIN